MVGSRRLLARTATGAEVVVLGEGLLHRAVQLLSSPVERPSADRIDRYVALVPKPDLVVHVVADADACATRVVTRGVWDRLSHLDADAVGDHVGNAHGVTEAVRDALARQGCAVIDVVNDGSLAEVGDRVRDLVVPRLVSGVALPSPGGPA